MSESIDISNLLEDRIKLIEKRIISGFVIGFMAEYRDWIDSKLKEISEKLPTAVHENPASFACGYNSGYKQALLDFQSNFINEEDTAQKLLDIHANEECDHEAGEIMKAFGWGTTVLYTTCKKCNTIIILT